MGQIIYDHVAYCYFIAYGNSTPKQYELFLVVNTQAGKTANFTPSGDTLTLANGVAPVLINIANATGAPAAKITKRYSAIVLNSSFNLNTSEIALTFREAGRSDWMIHLYFKDADDIGTLGAIDIDVSGKIALNCPYVYMHAYQTAANTHFPRMLVPRLGYDYSPDMGREQPKDPLGANQHPRTAVLNINPLHNTLEWLSPAHLNAESHSYNDPDTEGYYIGQVEMNNNPGKVVRKGKVKNSAHPVQPSVIISFPDAVMGFFDKIWRFLGFR